MRLPQYQVGAYPKDKIHLIQDLFRASFGGREMPTEMFDWQFERNPYLKHRTTSLWDKDKLIAYIALTPFPVILHGNKTLAAVSGNLMADVHYLGASIQLLAESQKQNSDISIIIGFPNKNSFSSNVKFAHHHYIGDIAFWTARAQKGELDDEFVEFFKFDTGYETLCHKLAKTHEFINYRTAEYMNWRIFARPTFNYKGYFYLKDGKKMGYVIVDTYEEAGVKQLQVIDILGETLEVIKHLLKNCIYLAHQWKCKTVKLWLTSSKYKETLENDGFVYGDHPFKFTIWDQDLELDKCYITMIDSDIF